MTQIELVRQEIERRIKHWHCAEFTDEMLKGPNGNDGFLSFLDTLEGGSSEIPTLPFAEKEGIPGKDFIPVEWVDACERYGKWIIVKVALISELLFQLLTTGMGGWGKRPEQEPEVDLDNKVTFDCISKRVTMTIRELINYYIDRECCDVAEECGF